MSLLDLKQKLVKVQERLSKFESKAEIADILQVYNQQIQGLEETNRELVGQLRKVIRKQMETQPVNETIKHLRSVLARLTAQFERQSQQLDKYREMERVFELHKRQAEDGKTRVMKLSKQLDCAKQTLQTQLQKQKSVRSVVDD